MNEQHYLQQKRLRTAAKFVLKWLLFALTAILFSTLETRFLPSLRLYGASVGFGAALTVSAALCEGSCAGAFFGLFCGMLTYLSGGTSELVYMLLYMAGGYTAGMLGNFLLEHRVIPVISCTAVLVFITVLLFNLFFMILPGYTGISYVLIYCLCKAVLCAAFSPLVYLPICLLSRLFRGHEEA